MIFQLFFASHLSSNPVAVNKSRKTPTCEDELPLEIITHRLKWSFELCSHFYESHWIHETAHSRQINCSNGYGCEWTENLLPSKSSMLCSVVNRKIEFWFEYNWVFRFSFSSIKLCLSALLTASYLNSPQLIALIRFMALHHCIMCT